MNASRRTVYALIDQAPYFYEAANRKSRNRYNFERAALTEHPIGNLICPARWLPNQKVVDPVVFVFTDYEYGLASQGMKRVGDDGFVGQKTRHYVSGPDGGGRAWAIIATVLTTAKLNGVDPYA